MEMNTPAGQTDVVGTGTPLGELVMNSVPRSSIAGYNLRPAEVLKRRLSNGKLKFACASTPRRKSSRPKAKGFASAKKSVTRRIEDFGESTDFLDQCGVERRCEGGGEDVNAEGSCVEEERKSSENDLDAEIINGGDKTEEGIQFDLLSSIKRKRFSSDFHPNSTEEPISGVIERDFSQEAQPESANMGADALNTTPNQSTGGVSASGNENVSDQMDSFSTPCLGTPNLNTTFIKDETVEAEHEGIKVEPISHDEQDVIRPQIRESGSRKSRSSQLKEEKENRSQFRSRIPEPRNVKKVEFTLSDLVSCANHEDIKLYAQIQEDFFPLQVSKTKMDRLLSSEDSPTVVDKAQTPLKTPASKIPKLTSARKSAVKFAPAAKAANPRLTISSSRSLWNAARPQELRNSIVSSDAKLRYRRHTISSAAKAKQSHLLPVVSEMVVAIPETIQQQVKNKSGTRLTFASKRVGY